ncbi:MAG: DUF4276 family protein [Planctomycetota bacterium]|jgi:hypothetical protein
MKVWVYVEGESDRKALEALWESWRNQLRGAGHGISIITLVDKARFLGKIGARAGEKLCNNNADIVIGLPDLYPTREYQGTAFEHSDLADLKRIQKGAVLRALQETFGLRIDRAKELLARFYPCALKYDLEMLLLAAKEQLRSYLRTPDQLGRWRNPVEDQDQDDPPKRIVEQLFRTKSATKRAYRDTKDASAVLRNVPDIETVLYGQNGAVQCPVFKELLDWIGERTGVPAYPA